MKVDMQHNSGNYAGAYYAPAILAKKTGNASAVSARLRKVVYEKDEEGGWRVEGLRAE